VVWSAAVIVPILAGSLGWIVRDWQVRRTEAESRVAEALAVAEPKLRQGESPRPGVDHGRAQGRSTLGRRRGSGTATAAGEPAAGRFGNAGQARAIRLDQATTNGNGFDLAGADPAYAKAFREYGIDVEALGALEAATQIPQRAIGMHLAAALGAWAMARRFREKMRRTNENQSNQEGISWKNLLQVAQAADPDTWRGSLREALANDKWESEDLKKLATSAPIQQLAPATLTMFGNALRDAGEVQLAVELLRKGQRLYPDDFWINDELAGILRGGILRPNRKAVQLEHAIGFYRAAVALRPQSSGVHLNLGLAFADNGQVDEAIGSVREAVRLSPDYPFAHNILGVVLRKKGLLDEAIACHKKAIQLLPDFFQFHTHLGNAIADKGRLDEAIACHREAIRLRKDDADAHFNFGNAFG
jgi:tetratricopeptide (TPR) repeat protein